MFNNTIIPLNKLGKGDVARVGGKNASLGEMIQNLSSLGIKVPGGFAITGEAFLKILDTNKIRDEINRLFKEASQLDLTKAENLKILKTYSETIQNIIRSIVFPAEFISLLKEYLADLKGASLAVRSSAVDEDSKTASFAGQHDTFLNVPADKLEEVIRHILGVYASLYSERVMNYRIGIAQESGVTEYQEPTISVGVQRMVKSNLASSGVIFTMDTESKSDKVTVITGAYGLGENIVGGNVTPDSFTVYKKNVKENRPAILSKTMGDKFMKMVFKQDLMHGMDVVHSADETPKDHTINIKTSIEEQHSFILSDDEIHQLAKMAQTIEDHYGQPMDIEWAKDGVTGELFIVQARPVTVTQENLNVLTTYTLQGTGTAVVSGVSVGDQIGQGHAFVTADLDFARANFKKGDVLVTDMTTPDWEPIMKLASAIVTNRGGRTCHAAIIARELGIPAVVGTGNAMGTIKHGQEITVSCAEGDTGKVYSGIVPFKKMVVELDKLPEIPCKLMENVGNPGQALAAARLPNKGVGLARMEFILSGIGVHPRAILDYNKQTPEIKEAIDKKIAGYSSPKEYFVQKLAQGVAMIGAAFEGKPVIVRFSDFKSNEYSQLLGGKEFEESLGEENPMIGLRGASRYHWNRFEDCFEMECQAIKFVREKMGLTNVEVMIPFVRTVEDLKAALNVMEKYGLKRGENGLRVIMMCEIPSNALIARQFLQHVDGFSIGSNDLTQTTLGVDRDAGNPQLSALFDERNDAVKVLISMAIAACKEMHRYIGICGQGPSDKPDFAQWLLREGIESMSLIPSSLLKTRVALADVVTQMSPSNGTAHQSTPLRAPGNQGFFSSSSSAVNDPRVVDSPDRHVRPGNTGTDH